MADQPYAFPTASRPLQLIDSGLARAAVLGLFATTIFISSSLLFVVQPLIGKLLLPALGGTPAVWNTCMVFFQAVLLAGYAYAHWTTTWLGPRRQALVHILVLLLPLTILPFVVLGDDVPPTNDNPAWWLLQRLTIAVGLPFFAVSTSAPLLQKWFSNTDHPAATDPYFLYAASNFGSLLALLGYPLLIEPTLNLGQQSHAWTSLYVILVGLAGVCAYLLWRLPPAAHAHNDSSLNASDSAATPTWSTRAWWTFLAFVPSSLMLGVTTHITTDLAAVPLLWVLPLAIYLLTFVLVFARRAVLPQTGLERLMPAVLLPVAVLLYLQLPGWRWLLIPLHLVLFFLVAMVCHGRLAASRPPTRHLTEFYLLMSVGGVLGGVFNALVAPVVFTQVIEYPLVMVLACLALPATCTGTYARMRDFVWPAALGLLTVGAMWLISTSGYGDTLFMLIAGYVVPLIICFEFRRRPLRLALGLGALLVACHWYTNQDAGRLLHRERNFFGVKRVMATADNNFRVLVHGGVRHGSQAIDPALALEPTTYYHRNGPLGDVFAIVQAHHGRQPIGLIGLGAGTAACYARPGQEFTFYEIDPGVAEIARDPRYFSFLQKSPGNIDIVLGDGRLTIAGASTAYYGLIVLDAFSSDSIPTHLVTREALRLYLDKLADGGLLAFHVSNQYLDLKPLLGNLAAEAGLQCYVRQDTEIPPEDQRTGRTPSEWVVMGRQPEDLGDLPDRVGWERLLPTAGGPTWTDQYSNILSLMKW